MRNRSESISTAAPRPAFRGWQFIFAGLSLIVVVGLLFKLAISANVIAHIFSYAFQVDEAEGMIVSETLLLDKGVPIYALPQPDIFICTPFTPLYYLLNWPAMHFGPVLPSFKPGRALSLLAVAGVVTLLVLIAATFTRHRSVDKKADWVAAGVCGAIFASLGLVAFWGSLVKPDMTALFFSLLGLYCGARWLSKDRAVEDVPTEWRRVVSWRQNRWLYGAALAAALALDSKQTSVAGAAALGVYLLLVRRDIWAVLRYSIAYLVLALGPLLALDVATNGGFWYHAVTLHQLPWSADRYIGFAGGFVQIYIIYLALALLFVVLVVAGWLRQRRTTAPTSIDGLAAIYVAMGALASLSAGTYGGNHNHLLEFASAMALAAGLCVARCRTRAGVRGLWRLSGVQRRALAAYVAVLVLLVIQVFALSIFEGKNHAELRKLPDILSPARTLFVRDFDGWLPREYRDPQELDPNHRFDEIAAFLHNAPGPVYSDNVSLVLASGKPLTTTDPFTQVHAVYFGRWDESQLVADILARKFTVIAVQSTSDGPPYTLSIAPGNSIKAAGIYITPGMARAILKSYPTPPGDKELVFDARKAR